MTLSIFPLPGGVSEVNAPEHVDRKEIRLAAGLQIGINAEPIRALAGAVLSEVLGTDGHFEFELCPT